MDNVFIERLERSVKYEDICLKAYGPVPGARRGLVAYFRFYSMSGGCIKVLTAERRMRVTGLSCSAANAAH